MHILIVHQAFATLDEAGGTRHYELASYLVRHGHRVTIIASPISYLSGRSRQARPRWIEKETPQEGITVLRTFTYSGLHRSFIHRIFSFLSFMVSSFLVGLQVSHVDLVWGTSPPIFQGATAWLLARIKRVPYLLEIRDLWPTFAIAVGVLHNPLIIRMSLWLERFLYSHADRVMVNSPGYIEHVTRRGARRVELVPNGADPNMFTPDEKGEAFLEKNGLTGKFVAIYAGAHGLSNDLDVVLDAAVLLKAQPDIRFVFLGDGKEKPRLQAKARALGLDNVVFLPPVPKVEMDRALAASGACIAILKPIPEYKTTYPNKVFDYMAAGRPVVLAIDGVIRQVVEEAGAGLFVPPGDPGAMAQAVLTLANDPALVHAMGLAGRKSIETRFNRAELADKMKVLIEDMALKKRSHA